MTPTQCIWRGMAPALVGFSMLLWATPSHAQSCQPLYTVTTVTVPPVDLGGYSGDAQYWDLSDAECPRGYGMFTDQLTEFHSNIVVKAPVGATVGQRVNGWYDTGGESGPHYDFWWYSPEYYGQYQWHDFDFSVNGQSCGGWYGNEFAQSGGSARIMLPAVVATYTTDLSDFHMQTCDITIPRGTGGLFPSGQWTLQHLQYDIVVTSKWDRIHADNQLTVANVPNDKPYQYKSRIAPHLFPEAGTWSDQEISENPAVIDHIDDGFEARIDAQQGQEPGAPKEDGFVFQNGHVFDYWQSSDNKVLGTDPSYGWVAPLTFPPAPAVPDATKAVTAVWKHDIELKIHIVNLGVFREPGLGEVTLTSDSVDDSPRISTVDFTDKLTHGYEFTLGAVAPEGFVYYCAGYSEKNLDADCLLQNVGYSSHEAAADVTWLTDNPIKTSFTVPEPAGPGTYYDGGVITVFFVDAELAKLLKLQKQANAEKVKDCYGITSWLGDPVYPFSGEFCQDTEDLRVKGPGMDFVWARKYASRTGHNTAQGYLWNYNYNIYVTLIGTRNIPRYILYHGEDDRIDLFWKYETGNVWHASGRADEIEYAGGDAAPVMHLRDGTTQNFSPFPSTPGEPGGQITGIVDRNGNEIAFSYNAAGQLASVTDTLGREYTVSHGGSPDRITGVYENYAGSSRSVTYEYDAAGNLTAVHGPGGGETTVYGYGTGGQHNLETITDARGNQYLANYYTGCQVARQRWGLPSDIEITFGYEYWYEYWYTRVVDYWYSGHARGDYVMAAVDVPGDRDHPYQQYYDYKYTRGHEDYYKLWTNTTVTDRNGNAMDMLFWGNLLMRKTEGGAVTQYSYNAMGMPDFILYPNGNRTHYVYGADGMNPIEIHRGNGGSDDVVEKFTYLPGLSGCSCGTSFVKTHTDGRGKVTTNDYDTHGNLTATTHPDGGVDQYEYNLRGQVVAHTWPGGRRDTFAYDTSGYMTGITQDAGTGGINATVSLTRDARGNVVAMTDANGNMSSFEYDAHDRVTRVESPAVGGGHNVVAVQHDENGNTTNVHFENAATGEWQDAAYEYEILNYRTKTTLSGARSSGDTPVSLVTEYTYDGNRNVTGITPGGGGTPITFTYNARNLVTGVQRGSTVISYEYDGNGNVTAAIYGGGRHEYTYDSHDQLVAAKDPLDNLTALAYDANGNVASVDRRDGQGRSLLAASYTYDDVNRLITRAVGAATTTFEYSTASELTKVTNPNGHAVSFGHDTMNRLTSASNDAGDAVSYTYDANGNVLTATQAGSGGTSYTTHCTYDALNRLVSVVDSANHQTSYGYDARSNVTSVTKADGKKSAFAYDGLDRLIQAIHDIDGLHVTLSQAWDSQSRLQSRTDGNGLTTQYGYDALDRVSQVTYADASTRSYTYDDFSNLTGVTSANGASASFTYDALRRMVSRTLTKGSSSETAHFAYDGLSRLVSASVPGSRVSREYDSLGNLTAEALNGEAVRATYDPAGNMLSQTYPHGRTLSFAYDAAERLTGISEDGTGLVSYGFEKPNRLASKLLGNGVATAYSYDNAQNVTGITAAKNGTVLDAWGFAWDSVYNKTGRTDVREGVASTYQYDGLQRLIESVKDAGADPVHYTLDAAGNRTGVTDGPDAGTYVLGAMHQYASAPAGGLTYDANGNLLTINQGLPNAQEFVYDAQDQLVRHVAHHAGGWQPMAGSWTTAAVDSASGTGRIVKAREPGFDALSFTYTAQSVSTDPESYGFAAVRAGLNAEGCVIYVGVRIRGANLQLVLYSPSGETVLATANDAMTAAGTEYDLALNIDRATGTVTLQRALHGESLAAIASASTGATGLSPDLLVLGAGTATSYAFTGVTTSANGTSQGELPDRPVTTTFQYDPFGRKVRKIVDDGIHPPQTTRYAYSGWQVVEEQDNTGTPQASYVYGRYIDEPVQMKRGDNTAYYLSDDLYNVTALTDPDGNVVERYRYEDFGAPHVYSPTGTPLTASSTGNPYLFTGRAYDSDLQLYDYRSRHLHPGLGRFMTRDRIGLWGDPMNMGNPYSYVGNAPGMGVDPYGFDGFLAEAGKVIGILNPTEVINYYFRNRTVDGRPLVKDAPAPTAAPEPYGELPAGIHASDLGPGLHAKMKEGVREGLDGIQRYVAAGSIVAGPVPGMVIDGGNGLLSGARGNAGDMLANFGGVLLAGISATGKLGKGGASACDAAVDKVAKKTSDFAIHHIVPLTAEFGDKARVILAKYGIDISHEANLVALPTTADSAFVGMNHLTLHTHKYYDAVVKALEPATSREEVIQILLGISERLINGTFPK